MDLTISEEILIIVKSYGLVGKPFVKKNEITDSYILLQDIFYDKVERIDKITPRELEVQIVDGTITMLKKIGLLDKSEVGYILTKKGDIFITNKLSSNDALSYLRASLEIASLPELQRHLYALLVALKHSNKEKVVSSAENLEKNYLFLKDSLRSSIKSRMGRPA